MENKAFILDFNLIKEQELSIEEFICLIYLSNGENHENYSKYINNLQDKQFIKIGTDEEIILREKSKQLIELISVENLSSVKSKKEVKKSDRLAKMQVESFVEEFRNKWKGLKPGSMGSLAACKEKLFRWMKENPSYNPEQILKAADIYINSLNNYTYLQQADYFIYKKEGKDEHSRLSAFIDETYVEDDWTSNLS